jgi:hypothetical protein
VIIKMMSAVITATTLAWRRGKIQVSEHTGIPLRPFSQGKVVFVPYPRLVSSML